MPAPQEIIDLVQRFHQYNAKYTAPSYNEFQVRREFIDPLFRALGWDVDNAQGYDERYKEVIHEDTVKVGDSTKAPDYSFRVGGMRKFFVEAKKPAVNLKENPEPAYQLRRYAWSAQLPVSILTDFEEFIVYDCTKKPSLKDKASASRIFYCKYSEFDEKWDEIASKFSKQAIYTGGYDDFVDQLKKKKGGKGTAGIDAAFLAEIEGWRDLLARNIALRNQDLSVRELNLAVQKTIDRIVFLRICEDRGVEEYGQLRTISGGKDVYDKLKMLYLHADAKYNSGLFHFRAEPGREEPDVLTQSLVIDDKVLKQIIKNLYYPDCPYEFSVFPSDILGQVYEQFLGKVIRLTASHQAKVEEKPEVKKAGGVFYTPTYIVDYIVKQTVGTLVEGKTPTEVADLRILDPACGSGSFLIGAYQYLLDWHTDWYIQNLVPLIREGKAATDKDVQKLLAAKPATQPGKGRGRKKRSNGDEYLFPIYPMSEDDWRLTTEEKKRILLNNIYGVDIDQQAVEVTKLSLLLKVLEGEKSERIGKQLTITQERVLPSLHQNIKCGNSLIGTDIYNSDVQVTLDGKDDEAYYRINAFDWETEFAPIMSRGGFDAVIGNPPYVRQELLKEQKEYLKSRYLVYQGTADLYVYFIERGISLLRENGQFSYIVANKWMRANYGKPLRVWLKEKRLEEIIDFGDLPVFQTATTYPCILRVMNGPPNTAFSAVKVSTLDFNNLTNYVEDHFITIRQNLLDEGGWSLVDERTQRLLTKIMDGGVPLGEYVNGGIFRGIVTGLNKAFVIDEITKERLIAEDPKSEEIIKPFLAGKNSRRYLPPWTDDYLIFTRHGINIKEYPAIESYLKQFRAELTPKPDGWSGDKWNGRKPGQYQWYEIQDKIDYYPYFEEEKIIYPEICKGPEFTIDKEKNYTNNKCFIIPEPDKYLLGILNSALDYFYFETSLPKLRGGFFMPASVIFKDFPVRTIDFTDPADVARHDRMVTLVDQMLSLNRKLADARLGSEKDMLSRRIEATDSEIDRLVYDLYGLTEEEIGIIEGSLNQ